MKDFLKRVYLARLEEQAAMTGGPMPRLACKCGRRLKPINTSGKCFHCTKASQPQPECENVSPC